MNNKNTIYRIRKNLKGKPLSAQTVASFLFVQGKDNVAGLSVEAPPGYGRALLDNQWLAGRGG